MWYASGMHPVFAWLPHGADWIYMLGFLLFFVVLGSAIWIAALLSCIKHESPKDSTMIVWVLVIVFTHCLGGLLYFLVRRPQRIRELGH